MSTADIVEALKAQIAAGDAPRDRTLQEAVAEIERLRAEHDPIAALARLVKIAKGSSGQCARVANFLLAWWNARRDGGFDFTDMWNVDQQIQDDMIAVFALAARSWAYPDKFGYQADFEALVTQWRGKKRRKRS